MINNAAGLSDRITALQFAHLCNVTPRAVRQWIKDGRLAELEPVIIASESGKHGGARWLLLKEPAYKFASHYNSAGGLPKKTSR